MVEVQANIDVEVKIPDIDWVTNITSRPRGLVNNGFTFSVASNPVDETREAQVIFCNKDTSLADTLIVRQIKKEVKIEKTTYVLSANEQVLEVEVYHHRRADGIPKLSRKMKYADEIFVECKVHPFTIHISENPDKHRAFVLVKCEGNFYQLF